MAEEKTVRIKMSRLMKMEGPINALKKRVYKNSRHQRAVIIQLRKPVEQIETYKEAVRTYMQKHAPNGQNFTQKDMDKNPSAAKRMVTFVQTEQDEIVELSMKPVITDDQIDELQGEDGEWEDNKLTGDEMEVLLELGLIDESESEKTTKKTAKEK